MDARNPDRRFAWIPWLFAGGMALVVAVNGALIYFAFASWSGLAAEHAYERGRQYNRAIEAGERQEALGWSLRARIERDAAGGAALVVEAADRQGRGLDGLAVEAVLERPVGNPDPRRLTLQGDGAGRYAGRLAGLAKGQWEVRLAASAGGERVLVTRRLFAP
jgi:nitrogen fixation protein FixH